MESILSEEELNGSTPILDTEEFSCFVCQENHKEETKNFCRFCLDNLCSILPREYLETITHIDNTYCLAHKINLISYVCKNCSIICCDICIKDQHEGHAVINTGEGCEFEYGLMITLFGQVLEASNSIFVNQCAENIKNKRNASSELLEKWVTFINIVLGKSRMDIAGLGSCLRTQLKCRLESYGRNEGDIVKDEKQSISLDSTERDVSKCEQKLECSEGKEEEGNMGNILRLCCPTNASLNEQVEEDEKPWSYEESVKDLKNCSPEEVVANGGSLKEIAPQFSRSLSRKKMLLEAEDDPVVSNAETKLTGTWEMESHTNYGDYLQFVCKLPGFMMKRLANQKYRQTFRFEGNKVGISIEGIKNSHTDFFIGAEPLKIDMNGRPFLDQIGWNDEGQLVIERNSADSDCSIRIARRVLEDGKLFQETFCTAKDGTNIYATQIFVKV